LLWTFARALRVAAIFGATVLAVWIVLDFSLLRLVLLLLSPLAVWLGVVLEKRLRSPYFNTGSDSYLAIADHGLTQRAVAGGLLRAAARLLTVGALALYFLNSLIVAIGGRRGYAGRLVEHRLASVPPEQLTFGDHIRALLLDTSDHPLVVGLAVVGAIVAFRVLDRLGARIHARKAKAVLEQDQRQQILYLPNFGDDRLRLATPNQITRRGFLAEYDPFRRTRFEEVVVQRLNMFGPVVAVSDPHRQMTHLGAAKMSLPFEGWQNSVEELGASALAVVISAAPRALNEGLKDEIEIVAQKLGHHRIVMVFGPARRPKSALARWQEFYAEARKYDIFRAAAPAVGPASAQVAIHIGNGKWHGWGAPIRTEATYVVSAMMAMSAAVQLWKDRPEAFNVSPDLNGPQVGRSKEPESALRRWASDWLTRLVVDGGAHGPGSRRTIAVDGSTFSTVFSADQARESIEMQLLGPRSGFESDADRNAVTYEGEWHGGPALWIDAVAYCDRRPVDRVILVQPYRTLLFGRTVAAGPMSELNPEDHTAPRDPSTTIASSATSSWL
jgi:hypothetical protein